MSRENVEIVRRMFDAHLRGDFEASLAMFDPEVEFDTSLRPDGRVWRGREGVRRAMLEWIGTWDDYRLEIHRYIDAGDRVVVVWTERGRGKASGITLELHGGNVHTVNDGRVVQVVVYDAAAKALEAVGHGPPAFDD